jgi:hypothetical protein
VIDASSDTGENEATGWHGIPRTGPGSQDRGWRSRQGRVIDPDRRVWQ